MKIVSLCLVVIALLLLGWAGFAQAQTSGIATGTSIFTPGDKCALYGLGMGGNAAPVQAFASKNAASIPAGCGCPPLPMANVPGVTRNVVYNGSGCSIESAIQDCAPWQPIAGTATSPPCYCNPVGDPPMAGELNGVSVCEPMVKSTDKPTLTCPPDQHVECWPDTGLQCPQGTHIECQPD